MLVTIGVLAAFRYDVKVAVVNTANYWGLGWLPTHPMIRA